MRSGIFMERREGMVAWLMQLFNCWFETGRVPRDWCRACIVPCYNGKGQMPVQWENCMGEC